MLTLIDQRGLLFVGDSQMSALGIRAHIQQLEHYYLSPLALTGNTAEALARWIAADHEGQHELQPFYRENDQGERRRLPEGYGAARQDGLE